MKEQLKTTASLNAQYAGLCAKLGDLVLNKERLEAEIAKIREQINVLDAALPVAQAAERSIKLDLEQTKEAEAKDNE